MKINAYAIMWNEELRLPWYLEHYSQFVDNIYLYDNYSSDRTLEIANANPKVKVESFGSPGVLSNSAYLRVKNNCWKGTDADWVIVGDIDEHLYHPDWITMLNNTPATILMPSVAYDLISEQDVTSYKDMRKGFFSPGYMKAFMFKPSQIVEMNYYPGCHQCAPTGNVIIEHPIELKMYHCAYPGFNWTCNRHKIQNVRRSAEDIKYGWSIQNSRSIAAHRAFFDRAINCGVVTPW